MIAYPRPLSKDEWLVLILRHTGCVHKALEGVIFALTAETNKCSLKRLYLQQYLILCRIHVLRRNMNKVL